MKLVEFIDMHAPALERDEARHNVILGVLGGASRNADARLETWTLGGPGACAICTPGRPIILGELDRDQCRALAETTHGDHTGVMGPDAAPGWFVERAGELGAQFEEPVPQRISMRCIAPPSRPAARDWPARSRRPMQRSSPNGCWRSLSKPFPTIRR
jgi:hypothetical protein